jgi:hypothetical protein
MLGLLPLLFGLGSPPTKGRVGYLQDLWRLKIGNNIDIDQGKKQASYGPMHLKDLRVSRLINPRSNEYEHLPLANTTHFKYLNALGETKNPYLSNNDDRLPWTTSINGTDYSEIFKTWEKHHSPKRLKNLFFSMKDNGFNSDSPTIVDEHNIIHDGKNRAIVAQALANLDNREGIIPTLKIYDYAATNENQQKNTLQRALQILQLRNGHKKIWELVKKKFREKNKLAAK